MRALSLLARRTRSAWRHLRSASSPPPPGFVQIWSIGIYQGLAAWRLEPATAVANPVITRDSVTDVQAFFVADPFMLKVEGTWHMFFEVMNRRTGRGEIGLATSRDGISWTYQAIVLREPFHLSYPYVFESAGEYFMIPESRRAGAIRLYRAERFPSQWKLVGALIEGPCLADASLFRAEDRWWMFVETGADVKSDTLRLYSATTLLGQWSEHPSSPVISADPHTARPAGRVLVHDGRVIRFAQDCHPRYGLHVNAFEVTELTTTAYRERLLTPAPILSGGVGWNRDGMHHVDAHRLDDGQWIACVDGWVAVDRRDLRR